MHFIHVLSNTRRHIRRVSGGVLCLLSLYLLAARVSAEELYTTDGVHVRSQPNASSAVCLTLESGTPVAKTGTSGNWIAVQTNGVSGYIYKDYLSKNPVSSSNTESCSVSSSSDAASVHTYVNSTEVNLRKKPNSHCKVLAVLEKDESVAFLSQSGNWSKIQRSDGSKGYIYSIYLGDNKPQDTESAQPSSSKEESISNYRSDAISYARQRLGDIYSQSLRDTEGYADCSSLVRDAFAHSAGTYIGGTTDAQSDVMADYFYSLSQITDAVPGDVLYHFSDEGNHTGIYLGNGQVLHASQKSGCVKISDYDISSTYWDYGCNAAAYCYDQQ